MKLNVKVNEIKFVLSIIIIIFLFINCTGKNTMIFYENYYPDKDKYEGLGKKFKTRNVSMKLELKESIGKRIINIKCIDENTNEIVKQLNTSSWNFYGTSSETKLIFFLKFPNAGTYKIIAEEINGTELCSESIEIEE